MANILIGITGSIAAYKIPQLVRLLRQQNHQIRIIMSKNAHQFVSSHALQALSGHDIRSDLFDLNAELAMSHIELARWADLFLIAPASANTIAKLAHGIADDLISTVYLATTAPVLIAPAMNTQMYIHPKTQENLEELSKTLQIINPTAGDLACGENGIGRMAELETIVEALTNKLSPQNNIDWRGKRLVITAGATIENIDPVRYISNYSSGKMGLALTLAGQKTGAEVVLIAAKMEVEIPKNIKTIRVKSALEMYEQALALESDIFIGAAAVADYRPEKIYSQKYKKNKDEILQISLVENPDVIASYKNKYPRSKVIGFAAETENLIDYARTKLEKKNLDMIVANNVADSVFGNDNNEVKIITTEKVIALDYASKNIIAEKIISQINKELFV